MDIETVFGVKWRLASYPEILIIIGILLAVILLLVILRSLQYLRDRKIHDQQLFLFKMKRTGLSNFQIKILNNMVQTLNLSNPNLIFDKSELFERAVVKFIDFLKRRNESTESLESISKDITITYDKIYSPSRYKKPLKSINEVERGQFLYFSAEDDSVFLGKILSVTGDSLKAHVFCSPRYCAVLKKDQEIQVFIWRIGDAEYEFVARISSFTGNDMEIHTPEDFTREKELRHPFIDVLVSAVLKKPGATEHDPDASIQSTLVKLNDYEAVLRISKKLEYNSNYEMEFELMEFQIKSSVRVIANRTIEDGAIFYYAVRFQEMSEVGEKVLNKYISEHL